MNKKIALSIFVFLIMTSYVFATESDIVYSLQIKYSNGQLLLEKIGLLEGTAPDRIIQPENGYLVNVISSANKVLYSFKFEIPTVVARAPPKEWFNETTGEQIIFPNESAHQITETTFNLIVPYFSDAKSIDIYDSKDTLMLSIDVSQYSKQPSMNLDSIYIVIIAIVIIVVVAGIFIKKKLFRKANNKIKHKRTKNKRNIK